MAAYIVRRLIALLPVLFIVSILTFSFIHLLPGDPVTAMLGPDAGASKEVVAARRHDLGLDQPLPVQYGRWIGKLLRFDLGKSAISKQPIAPAMKQSFPVTLQLALASFLVSIVIAVPLGVIAAYKRNTIIDRLLTVLSLGGVAVPSFWLGILLILLFSVKLRWLPPSGFTSLTTDPRKALQTLALPALSLGLAQAAIIMRQTRSSLLEVLRDDYIRTARAKGLHERTVLMVHALRNGLIPVITIVGLQVGRLLSGAVVIEQVFALPGLGRYGVNAINSRDYPVVQAVALISALIVVLANLLTDLCYGWLDPRIKVA